MQLLTKEVLAKLPQLYCNKDKGLEESWAVVKFFTPDSNWTWYASEGSPIAVRDKDSADGLKDDFMFFGLVDGFELELGHFRLSELQEVRGALGLPVERDRYFQSITLAKLMEQLEARRA